MTHKMLDHLGDMAAPPDIRRRRYVPQPMRLIVARCSVEYSGRLSARLPEALRLVMVKADGSLGILYPTRDGHAIATRGLDPPV